MTTHSNILSFSIPATAFILSQHYGQIQITLKAMTGHEFKQLFTALANARQHALGTFTKKAAL